jgi:hypothetical protein
MNLLLTSCTPTHHGHLLGLWAIKAMLRVLPSSMPAPSGGSSNPTLWGQLVDTVGPSHISYSKNLLVSSKPVGPGGPTGLAYIRHCQLPWAQPTSAKTELLATLHAHQEATLTLSFIVAMWESYLGLVVNDNICGLGLDLVLVKIAHLQEKTLRVVHTKSCAHGACNLSTSHQMCLHVVAGVVRGMRGPWRFSRSSPCEDVERSSGENTRRLDWS